MPHSSSASHFLLTTLCEWLISLALHLIFLDAFLGSKQIAENSWFIFVNRKEVLSLFSFPSTSSRHMRNKISWENLYHVLALVVDQLGYVPLVTMNQTAHCPKASPQHRPPDAKLSLVCSLDPQPDLGSSSSSYLRLRCPWLCSCTLDLPSPFPCHTLYPWLPHTTCPHLPWASVSFLSGPGIHIVHVV